jgi:hypothetical protein
MRAGRSAFHKSGIQQSLWPALAAHRPQDRKRVKVANAAFHGQTPDERPAATWASGTSYPGARMQINLLCILICRKSPDANQLLCILICIARIGLHRAMQTNPVRRGKDCQRLPGARVGNLGCQSGSRTPLGMRLRLGAGRSTAETIRPAQLIRSKNSWDARICSATCE